MKKIIPITILSAVLATPFLASASALTQTQAESLIAVVQSSPNTPASAFRGLITAFSNITTTQADSLIGVVQVSPGVAANAFVNLLVSFTQDAQPASNPSATTVTQPSASVSNNGIASQLGGALSSVYIQFNLNSIKTNGAALVTLAETEQTRLAALQSGRAQCIQAYNSAVTYQTQQNRLSLLNARNGLAINTALVGQVQSQGQYQLQLLAQQESTCEAAYPTMPGNMSSQIQDAINQIDDLRQRVQAGSVSDSEALSILQQYNSLQSEIYSFNGSIPSSGSATLPSASVSNVTSSSNTASQPLYTGGTITCSEVGDSRISCSDGTTCMAVGMNTLNCSGPGTITTSCQGNFTGGKVTCGY